MDIHEAIEILKANYPDACYEQLREAVDMAISALQAQDLQPTCNNLVTNLQPTYNQLATDTISRQVAIDALDEIESEVADGDGFQYEKWRRYFCELPSVTPDRCDTCRFVYYPKESNNDQ